MHPEKISSYDRLTRNIVLTVITVSLAPLILVGGVIFDQFRSIYSEKVYSHLSEVVDKHTTHIDAFLGDKLHEIQYLNTAYSYEQLISGDFLARTLRGMQLQYGRIFVDLGVIAEDGRQVAYAGPFDLLGADYSDADWYRGSRGRDASVSDVFEGLRQSRTSSSPSTTSPVAGRGPCAPPWISWPSATWWRTSASARPGSPTS